MPAVMAPSRTVRTDISELPIFQRTWPSATSTRGSTPVTHSTMAPQTSQEIVRSMSPSHCACGNAACSTLAPVRITASDISAGITSRNAARGIWSSTKLRAT